MSQVEQALICFLKSILPIQELDQSLLMELDQLIHIKEHPKGTILLREGEHCKSIFILKSGFARRYTFIDGKDVTLEFAFENEMITSLYSLSTSQASNDYIEAAEDCTVLRINLEDLKQLYSFSKSSLFIGRLLRERYFSQLEKRVLTLQAQHVKERYDDLLKKQVNIEQRASSNQIASYLGVTQEVLCQIRN